MKHLGACLSPLLLAVCASSGAAAVADTLPPAAPQIGRSLELRERYDARKAFGATSIFIDSVAVHHTYNEASTIICKDELGKWQGSQVSEIGPAACFRWRGSSNTAGSAH